ncbi:MAG: AarF/ABC1/UbiB kinase family protein, partial [Okeania sp. SIO2F4]|nr:AarF/ABC1/UbiB kinase family protein [Okeania sp. SIO2F4]
EHIKNIWQIIQDTPGFDAMQLVQLVPNILVKPEMQKMGQQVAGGLTQRAIARLIRQVLLSPEYSNTNGNGHKPKTQPQLSLPASSS